MFLPTLETESCQMHVCLAKAYLGSASSGCHFTPKENRHRVRLAFGEATIDSPVYANGDPSPLLPDLLAPDGDGANERGC
jgi:hypothetical protein